MTEHYYKYISGSYGAFAMRSETVKGQWKCYDSDYSWVAVMDDFGDLVAISSFTNMRGY